MLRDGWLHTGDIAVMDEDGFVTIVDRKRDVILASGFSIFPSEIEDVLSEHPAVEECTVVGVSHFYRGETVKAFVVVRAGEQVSEDELHRFCADRLVAYKVPAEFEFRRELPHNILGKVLRRVLRAEHEAARGRPTSPGMNGALVEHPKDTPAGHRMPESHPVSAGGLVDELERLVRLRDAGALTDTEFGAAKARLLG
jgi:hypothetical protein